MTTIDALVAYLASEGMGTLSTDLFAGASAPIPAGAGPFVSLIETGGEQPRGTHNAGFTAYRRPHVQVVVRGGPYASLRAKAEALYAALTLTNQTLGGSGGVWFLKVKPVQEPFDGGPDANGRPQIKFNVACERRG